ncbi:MAG: IS3 family transposase [Lentisphaerae bacterium]|nr:IS3 family transposase [Lentisphaerota bacterium]
MIARLKEQGFDLAELCEAMEVSRSGYYAHRRKPEGARRRKDAALRPLVAAAFERSRETYGTPRIRHELIRQTGEPVSRARIGRLMDDMGIAPRDKRSFVPRTTIADRTAVPAPNLLLDMPPTTAINQVWVTDITYIQTGEDWLYLAAVMDLHSRRILGWAAAPHMRAELVTEALHRACSTRSTRPPAGLIVHSDRGSQYTSALWQNNLGLLRMTSSMSRTANCYDNATMESFWATLKAEAFRHIPATQQEARILIHDFIDSFYNTHRLHSSLDYRSPIAFESYPYCHLN